MSEHTYVTRRNALLAVLAILIVISGTVFAVGRTDNKVAKQPTTQKVAAEEKGEVAGDSTTTNAADTEQTQASDDTTTDAQATVETASATPEKPAKKSNQTPAAQPATNPTTPTDETPAPDPEVPEEQPEEEPEMQVAFVPVGGASESFTLGTEDGSAVRWFPFCPATWSDDTLPEEKPESDMFMVMEVPQAVDGYVSSSIDFHIRAQDFAVEGDTFECGFYVMNDETGEGFVYTFIVVIVPADSNL